MLVRVCCRAASRPPPPSHQHAPPSPSLLGVSHFSPPRPADHGRAGTRRGAAGRRAPAGAAGPRLPGARHRQQQQRGVPGAAARRWGGRAASSARCRPRCTMFRGLPRGRPAAATRCFRGGCWGVQARVDLFGVRRARVPAVVPVAEEGCGCMQGAGLQADAVNKRIEIAVSSLTPASVQATPKPCRA